MNLKIQIVSSEERRERKNTQQKQTKKNQKMNRDLKKAGGKIVCHWSPRRDKNLGKIMTQNFPNLKINLEILISSANHKKR